VRKKLNLPRRKAITGAKATDSTRLTRKSGIDDRGDRWTDGFDLGGSELFAAEGRSAGTASPSRHRSLRGIRDVDPGGAEGQAHLTTTLQTQVLGHTTSFLSSRGKKIRGSPPWAKSAQDGMSSYSLQELYAFGLQAFRAFDDLELNGLAFL
jgi:hypothetical protein